MRITDLQLGQGKNILNISDVLSKLNIGDVLKAHILEFTADQLLLKLMDGTTVTASSMVPLDVKKGDIVDFRVKEKTDSRIFIETVKKGEPDDGNEDNIKLKLSRMDIKPDSKNIDIAKAIESNSLPFNKENFEKVLSAVKAFKDLSPQKAAFFASHNININEKSIKALSDLVDGRMKIGQALGSIQQLLEDMEDVNVLKNLEQRLANLKNEKNSENNKNQINSKSNDSTEAEKAKTSQNTHSAAHDKTSDIKAAEKYNKINSEEIINLLKNKGKDEGVAEILRFLKNNPGGLAEKNSQELNQLLRGFRINNENNAAESLKKVNENANDTNGSDSLKKESVLRRTLENIYVKLDSKNPELNVKKLYRDIYETLEVIKESVAGSLAKNSDEIMSKIESIQNNIKFLNELSNYSTYVQIPINLMNKLTNGEIYVLKRDSRKKKINPEDTTMYISLDTQNIGKVDSLISLNKKNISVNMRVEELKVSEFFKENHKQLYNRLADIGYKLVDLKCRVVSEDVNLLNINNIVKNETTGSRRAIDCKI